MATESLLRLPEVMRRTALSRSTIYAGIKNGWFPAPLKICPDPNARAVGWRESEVDEFVEKRIADSRAGNAA